MVVRVFWRARSFSVARAGTGLAPAFLIAVLLAAAAPLAAASEEVARVDGVVITGEDVDRALSAQLTELQQKIYDLRLHKVEATVAEQLLAKEAARRGLSVPALLDAEVTSKVGLVTEQEVDGFYQANKGRLKGDESTLREQIRSYLQNQKLSAAREAFVDSLRSQADVVISLKPPAPIRVAVAVDGAPVRGAPGALVTIVAFSDFQCPFCKRVIPTLEQIESRYGDKVRLVHRDFPIDNLHPQSRHAHEAARCAGEQGKFWAYYDALYANAPRTAPDQLKEYASELGLDVAAFQTCLDSGKYRAAVQADIDEGNRLGVNGTPTFFINGRMVSGAQPLQAFEGVIDEELTVTQ